MQIENGTLEPETVMSVRNELHYRKNSVVARALLQVSTGTVDIMAFDQGLGITQHVLGLDALVLVLEGNLEIVISSETHLLESEDVFLIPAGKVHSMKAQSPTKIILVTFKETAPD